MHRFNTTTTIFPVTFFSTTLFVIMELEPIYRAVYLSDEESAVSLQENSISSTVQHLPPSHVSAPAVQSLSLSSSSRTKHIIDGVCSATLPLSLLIVMGMLIVLMAQQAHINLSKQVVTCVRSGNMYVAGAQSRVEAYPCNVTGAYTRLDLSLSAQELDSFCTVDGLSECRPSHPYVLGSPIVDIFQCSSSSVTHNTTCSFRDVSEVKKPSWQDIFGGIVMIVLIIGLILLSFIPLFFFCKRVHSLYLVVFHRIQVSSF